MNKKGRVLCSSDWHGSLAGFRILQYLKPDDTLYYLGDAADRGRFGFQLLDHLTTDKRIRYIQGNHDEMFWKSVLSYQQSYDFDFNIWSIADIWIQNGGSQTFQDAIENIDKATKIAFALRNAPKILTYHSPKGHRVILEHAGHTPGITGKHDPLWDRSHFNDNWSTDKEYENTYLVHGHSPIQYLKFTYGYKDQKPLTKEEMKYKYSWDTDPSYKPNIIRYCDGHKFCVDLCSVVSNRVALLNLDTFEEIYFDE